MLAFVTDNATQKYEMILCQQARHVHSLQRACNKGIVSRLT